MRSKVLKRASQATVVNLTGDKKALDAASAGLAGFCSQLYSSGTASSVPDWSALSSLVTVKPNEGFSVPTQVHLRGEGPRQKPCGETAHPVPRLCGAAASCP